MQTIIRKQSYLKTIFLCLTIFLLVSPNFYSQSKMQTGSWSVSPSLADYSLHDNNGERSMTIEIRFKDPFKQKPKVFLSATQIDAAKETNVRYSVEAISISRDGFTLKVKTWSDSKIFSISGNWLAHTE
jgi:hypothetical protein